MKAFVEFVLQALAAHPERVSVAELYGRQTILLEARCHPDDLGRIIGKNGKTVGALRVLLSSLASKHQRKAALEIVE